MKASLIGACKVTAIELFCTVDKENRRITTNPCRVLLGLFALVAWPVLTAFAMVCASVLFSHAMIAIYGEAVVDVSIYGQMIADMKMWDKNPGAHFFAPVVLFVTLALNVALVVGGIAFIMILCKKCTIGWDAPDELFKEEKADK